MISSVVPHLTPVEVESVKQAFKTGADLSWDRSEGGSYVCYAGDQVLFTSGGVASFNALYDQAKSLRDVRLSAQEVAKRLIAVMSIKTPHSIKWLLEKAELDEDYIDAAKLIMSALAKAGKVKAVDVDGKRRWSLPPL